MKITNPAFNDRGMIPKKYTCEGEDVSPALLIESPPDGVKSFALIMHDPDAKGGDFVHWMLWNISPSVQEIKEGHPPEEAIRGINDFGLKGWGGPCPPSGLHRYEFHLYALDKLLDIPDTIRKEDLRNLLAGCALEEATLTGLYEKER